MNIIVEKMTNEYIDDLLVRAAHHSTAIEGNTLTLGDTISDECSNNPESIMIRNEYMDNIEKGVEALFSNLERDAWTMYMQGCSYKEIAERMDKTGKTVDNAICRAKKKLAEMLENR